MAHRILQFKAKYGDINFFLQDGKGLPEALEKIFRFNIAQEMYYDEELEKAKSILRQSDEPDYIDKVHHFMKNRQNYEYEEYDIDTIYTPDQEVE